jgi:hypothetical protein
LIAFDVELGDPIKRAIGTDLADEAVDLGRGQLALPGREATQVARGGLADGGGGGIELRRDKDLRGSQQSSG